MEIDPYGFHHCRRHRRLCRRRSCRFFPLFPRSSLDKSHPPPFPLPDDDNHDDDKRRCARFPPPSKHRRQTPTVAAIRRSPVIHRCRLLLSTSSQVGCRVVFPMRHRRPTPPNNAAHPPIATSQGGTISPTYHMNVLVIHRPWYISGDISR